MGARAGRALTFSLLKVDRPVKLFGELYWLSGQRKYMLSYKVLQLKLCLTFVISIMFAYLVSLLKVDSLGKLVVVVISYGCWGFTEMIIIALISAVATRRL